MSKIKYFNDEPEKRFLVFGYEHYYPMGGSRDLQGSFDTLKECEEFMENNRGYFEFWDVFDCEKKLWVDL